MLFACILFYHLLALENNKTILSLTHTFFSSDRMHVVRVKSGGMVKVGKVLRSCCLCLVPEERKRSCANNFHLRMLARCIFLVACVCQRPVKRCFGICFLFEHTPFPPTHSSEPNPSFPHHSLADNPHLLVASILVLSLPRYIPFLSYTNAVMTEVVNM